MNFSGLTNFQDFRLFCELLTKITVSGRPFETHVTQTVIDSG